MPYDIFISYASEDIVLAEQLHKRLCETDLNIWFDRVRLEPGFDWHQEIEQGCENSRILLPVLTPRWKGSEWTKYETYGAESVIPLVFEGVWEEVCTPPLERYQAEVFDCHTTESTNWSKLLSAIHRMIAQPIPDKTSRIANMRHRANEYFTGRESELLRIHEELHHNPRATLTQGRVRVIAAMGGAGKTTLARHYVEKFWRCYPEMFWVDCRMGIEAEFARLYAVMFPEKPKGQMTDSQLAEHVLLLLNGRETRLLILDNAEDEQSVMHWIPKTGGCHTLITSRFSGWSSAIKTCYLYVLEKDPAVKFLQQRSDLKASESELIACEELAKKLGYLPLALEQAAAYIQQQGAGFQFSDYLGLYERAARQLLAIGALGSTEYPDSVITTWMSTIEKLTSCGRAILRLSSFLADTLIPVDFLVKNGEQIVQLGCKLYNETMPESPPDWELFIRGELMYLRNYSLIQLDGHYYSLHKLVQAVERYNISSTEIVSWVSEAVDFFTTYAPSSGDLPHTWDVWSVLYPHGVNLYSHTSKISAKGRIDLLDGLARFSFGKGRFSVSLEYEKEAFNLAESTYGGDAEETNDRLINYGESLNHLGRYEEAEALFRRSLEWEKAHKSHDHRDIATCLNYLGMVRRSQGDKEEALTCFKEGLDICDRISQKSCRTYVKLMVNLAQTYLGSENEEAEVVGRKAWMQARSEFGENDILTCYSQWITAIALNNQGKYDSAEPLLRDTIQSLTTLLGEEHPDVIYALKCHGPLLGNLNRWREAIVPLQKVLLWYQKTKGENSAEALSCMHELAKAHQKAGDRSEAESLCRHVLSMRETGVGFDHPDTLDSIVLLISCIEDNQKNDEAVAFSKRLIETKLSLGEEGIQPQLALDINNLSVWMKKKGRFKEAEVFARKSLAIDEKARGENHPKIPHRLSNLSILLIANDNIKEAEQQLERAWLLKEGNHDLTSARILFLKLAIALVNGQTGNDLIRQLKTLLTLENLPDHADVIRTWDIQCVIDYLKGHLPEERVEFMTALSDVLNEQSPESSLEYFPDWQPESPVSVERKGHHQNGNEQTDSPDKE